jgi:hypothetical protein
MESFHKYISEYKKQLKKGDISKAYRGLMKYIMDLRIYFKNKYPDYLISGSIYYGYMDMTYFPLFPKSLKHHKLKIAIVFNYGAFQFEVWLSASNRQIQKKYWKLFKESNWDKYTIPSNIKGIDSIIHYIIVDNPDFSDLDTLTRQIEKEALRFIVDVENFLSKY